MTKMDKFYKAFTGIVGLGGIALALLGAYVDDGDNIDREFFLSCGLIGAGLFLTSKGVK